MKRKYITIILLLIIINSMGQSKKITQNIVKIGKKNKIIYNKQVFDIDTTVLTIKVSDYSKFLKRNKSYYNIIRRNKLGFVDISLIGNRKFDNNLQRLITNDNVQHIEYSTIGKYTDFISNDTYKSNQWYLSRINVFKAWDITMGNSNIIVGILDSGTDWKHNDLGLGKDVYQNINLKSEEDDWINNNNPNTGNKIDDDSNGLIDDWKGWNFDNNSNNVITNNSHGTVVAGIISAKTHNDLGISGIAGGQNNEGVKILAYCIGEAAPISNVLDDAIIQAVDDGVRIIQLSLSLPSSQAIDEAIDYAVDNDVLIICAAGNNGTGTIHYPANNPNVMAVGAINKNNKRAYFSQYGKHLSIMAPGVDIYSTKINNSYASSNGTSFAAPQVSGVAALILSISPNLTGKQVRDIIEKTAQKVGGYHYKTHSNRPNGDWDSQMGYGLVNAYEAVKQALFGDVFIQGSNLLCDQSTYKIENLPAGASVTWSTSNGNLVLDSGQGDSIAVFQSVNVGKSIIQAKININGYNIILTKKVQSVSTSVDVSLDYISYDICPLIPFATFRVPKLENATYIWKNNGEVIKSGENNTLIELALNVEPGTSQNCNIEVVILLEDCELLGYYNNFNCEGVSLSDLPCETHFPLLEEGFSLKPNPTTDVITIDLSYKIPKRMRVEISQDYYQISIWDNHHLLKIIKTHEPKLDINISDLPKGFYYILVEKDGKVSKQTFVKE